MAFDLSTAKPTKPKFDMTSAKPVAKPFDPMTDAPRLPGEPGFDATQSPAAVTGDDRLQAAASGGNKGLAGLAGMPVDTALNVWDLGKAAIGSLQGAVTGKPPSDIFLPAERHNYIGSSEWNMDRMNEGGVETEARRPDDTASKYIHAGATGVPGALAGGGGVANTARQVVSGVAAGEAGQLATDLGLDPGMTAVAATAAGAGAGAAKVPKKGPPLQPYEAKTDAQRARAIDQKLLPSEVGDSPVGTVLEGLAGSQNVRRHMNKKNETTNTNLAASKIGADPKNMGSKSMGKLKEKEGAAYEAMKGIGKITPDGVVHADIGALSADKSTMKNAAVAKAIQDELATLEGPVDAAQLVERVRELRQQSSFNQSPPQGIGSKPDPKKVALGKAQRQIADALDGMLERNATAMGQPEVATNYKNSRKRIAKINSVSDATVGRKVQASELAKQGSRDVPLTEELGLIADAGEAFPHSTSRPQVGTETLSDTNWMQNLVAPVLSRVLASDTYQNSFGRKTAMGPASPVSEYFTDPNKPDFAPRGPGGQDELPPATGRAQMEAGRLAGDLELEGQGVAPMQRELSAETPPPTPQDGIPFTSPNGTGRAPNWDQNAAMDLVRELGLLDNGLQQTLPAPPRVNDTGLSLIEDLPVGVDRTRAARSVDTIDFEAPTGQEQYQPFKGGADFTQSLNPRTEQPRIGNSVNLADELSLAPDDVPGNYGPRDQGPQPGNTAPKGRPDLSSELGLVDDGPTFNRASAPELGVDSGGEPLDQRFGMPAPTRVTAENGKGYISYIPGVNGSRQITGAFVEQSGRGKGHGSANLIALAKETAAAGETLNSDTSVSAAQLKVYEKLRKAGKLEYEFADPEAAATALKDGTKLAGSQPVITNIRPVEEVVDVAS